MSLQRMLWRLDKDGIRVVWRRRDGEVTCCEHRVPYGPVGFGTNWRDALSDFLRKRDDQ